MESEGLQINQQVSGTELPSYPIWLLPNLLSLDAPLIALLWQDLLSRTAEVDLLPAGRLALALAVWAVYLGDRLLDALRPTVGVVPARHRFSRRYHRSLRAVLGLAIAFGIVTSLFVRPAVLEVGVTLGFAVLLYLWLVHAIRSPALPKEAVVAVLFAAGTTAVPWIRHGGGSVALAAAAVAFCGACLLNLAAIEGYESEHLRPYGAAKLHPLVRRIWCALPSVGLAFVLVFVAMSRLAPAALGAAALSCAGLAILHRRQDRIGIDAFRVLADASLLSPLPFLFWLRL